MKPLFLIGAVAGLAAAALPLLAAAQQKVDLGKREYDSNCAVCHGQKGRGDGPYGPMMGKGEIGAADITTLAQRNKGVFPFAQVYEVIDGTQAVKQHGPREMPIWGADYKVKGAEYYMEVPYDPATYVRTRILALVEYVYRLQVK
jgi:mono/diheme cytochrome c family protein